MKGVVATLVVAFIYTILSVNRSYNTISLALEVVSSSMNCPGWCMRYSTGRLDLSLILDIHFEIT